MCGPCFAIMLRAEGTGLHQKDPALRENTGRGRALPMNVPRTT